METREGLVNKEGAKMELTKRTFLKPEAPPPISRRNLSKQKQILTKHSTTNSNASYLLLRMCITSEWGLKLQGLANSCMTNSGPCNQAT